MFGIIDLASIPKDRYYLYRSQWNKKDATLHLLPHWTWPGREGKVTPVVAYTSYPSAELFVNGKSMGRKTKASATPLDYTKVAEKPYWERASVQDIQAHNDSLAMERYRLIWDDVVYQPGELKVVAFDEAGNPAKELVVATAGKAHHIVLTPNRTEISADGNALVYVTVQVADKNGNIVPTDTRMVSFKVSGAAEFLATANGDPTCLLSFDDPKMKLFSGAATAILRAASTPGHATLTVTAPGVKSATISIDVK